MAINGKHAQADDNRFGQVLVARFCASKPLISRIPPPDLQQFTGTQSSCGNSRRPDRNRSWISAALDEDRIGADGTGIDEAALAGGQGWIRPPEGKCRWEDRRDREGKKALTTAGRASR